MIHITVLRSITAPFCREFLVSWTANVIFSILLLSSLSVFKLRDFLIRFYYLILINSSLLLCFRKQKKYNRDGIDLFSMISDMFSDTKGGEFIGGWRGEGKGGLLTYRNRDFCFWLH